MKMYSIASIIEDTLCILACILATEAELLDTYSIIMIWAIRIAAKEDQIYKSVNAVYMITLAIVGILRIAYIIENARYSIKTEEAFISFGETAFAAITMTVFMGVMSIFGELGSADTLTFICIVGLSSMNFATILIIAGSSTLAMLVQLLAINIKRIKQKKKLESAAYIPWMHRAVVAVYITYSIALYNR